MHKYVLKLTKYTEEGAPTNETQYIYCDTPQQLHDRKKQYDAMRYTTTTEEGEVVVGYKMYKTEPMQAEYSVIEDFDSFCGVNKVLM